MNRIAVLLLLLSCLLCRGQNAPTVFDPNKKIPFESLQFDLAILHDALVKTHAGLYWYQPQPAFEERFADLKKTVNHDMTETEFYNLVTAFIANIRCGHTDTEMSEEFYAYYSNRARLLPFNLRIIGGRVFIVHNLSSDNSISPGSEIKTINGVKMDTLMTFMLKQQWTDGFIRSYNRIEHFFDAMLLGMLNYPDKYEMGLVDLNRHVYTATVQGIPSTLYEEKLAAAKSPELPISSFNYNDSLKTGVIKFRSFGRMKYRTFLWHSFKEMKKRKCSNLIIDLRGNQGGDGNIGVELYTYIAEQPFRFEESQEVIIRDPNDTIFRYGRFPVSKSQFRRFHRYYLQKNGHGTYDLKDGLFTTHKGNIKPKKRLHFDGKVYILTDIRTYSAAAELAAFAQGSRRATIVGRETGGAYNGNTSGWDFVLTLPKSGVVVTIPIVRTLLSVKGPFGQGVSADIAFEEQIADIVSGKDNDLENLLRAIRDQYR